MLAAAELVASHGVKVESHGAAGDPAEAILGTAESRRRHDRRRSKGMTGAKPFVLGSVPHKVAHHACCNVLIVYTS